MPMMPAAAALIEAMTAADASALLVSEYWQHRPQLWIVAEFAASADSSWH